MVEESARKAGSPGDVAENGWDSVGTDQLELVFCASFALVVFLALHGALVCSLLALGALLLATRLLQARLGGALLPPGGKAVLITGCDSGIGLGLAQRLADLGADVFAGCLNVRSEGATTLQKFSSTNNELHVMKLDVTSEEDVTNCLHYVEHHTKGKGIGVADKGTPLLPGLWSVVNNAGVMGFGEVELTPLEDFRRLMEVNVFGVIRVSKAFLPLVRRARGRVVNVTSVRGLLPFPENSAYVISKFAGEALSDVMRMELSKFGVKVVIVEPGNFGGVTGIIDRELLRRRSRDAERLLPGEVLEAYGSHRLEDEREAAIRGRYSSHPTLEPVLGALQEATLGNQPRTRYLVDGSNRPVDIDCMLARLRPFLPDPLLDFLTLQFLDLDAVENSTEVDSKTHQKLDD